MGNINDFVNKSNSDVDVLNDYLIVTNGIMEYNINVSEFFKVHTISTSHDHSQFRTESEINALATVAAGPVADTKIAAHETTWDHSTFIDSAASGLIADNRIAAYFPLNTTNLQDGDGLIYNLINDRWENSPIETSGEELELNDLSDVNLSSVANKQVLMYDSYGGWKNGSIALNDLSNVTAGYVQNKQTLIYNSYAGGWHAGSSSLTDLSDVTIGSVQNGQVLMYDEYTGWAPGNINVPSASIISLTDTVISSPQINESLIYDSSLAKWVNMSITDALTGVGWSGTFDGNYGQMITVVNGIITNVETAS